MEALSHLTECGLPGISSIPYGMHACHFYRDRAELVEALVPYFVAGLRNKERCLWITAPPLPATEATEALNAAWDGVYDAIEEGALRILDFDRWYASSVGLKGLDVVKLWLEEEERALRAGYNGLRITGNVTFLEPNDWDTFMEYERAASSRFAGRRIVALCSYQLQSCAPQQAREVIGAHGCAFDHPDANWQVVAVRK